MSNEEHDLVTAAWIARRAGVGRAAVANWRKRYADFPQPLAEEGNSPRFSWPAVRDWLVATGKLDQLAAMSSTETGTHRIGDAILLSDSRDRSLSTLPRDELFARVMVSLLPRVEVGMHSDDDDNAPVVLDPCCADPALLAAVADRFGDHVRLAGQIPDDVDVARVRDEVAVLGGEVRVGDSLAADQFTELRGGARAVLCVPPAAARTWPAADLAADTRWRFGLADAGDPELAWIQHCYVHLRQRGTAVVAISPVTASRPSGRHIRAALVRDGVLRDVIALPAGLTRSGEGAAHLWVLRRGEPARGVRMVDLTGVTDVPLDRAAWDALLAVDDLSVVRTVEPLELLDGDASLVPARYLRLRADASADDLGRATDRLRDLYIGLAQALPTPASAAAAVQPTVTLAELERSRAIMILPRDATPRAGDVLFRTMGREPVVATGKPDDEGGVAQVVGIDTERLDPHFVAMFVRADALAVPVGNTHLALTRDDVKRCRIPRMTLAEQRRYGEAHRRLLDLAATASRLAAVTEAVVAQTVHGLTTGALAPANMTIRENMNSETISNEKSAQ